MAHDGLVVSLDDKCRNEDNTLYHMFVITGVPTCLEAGAVGQQ